MSRSRALFLNAEVLGRSFSFNNAILNLVGEKEPEVTTAYFAEKKIEYKEEAHSATFSYTFNNDTDVKTIAEKTNIANIIRGKLTFNGDKKYTNNTKIIAAFTKQTHKAGDTITIAALKKEKKEYYKKINGAPMGYQVYLVVETEKLDGKTVQIKILESKSQDQKKKNVLKLVKADTDDLPVLTFAKLEDKDTTTESNDWIDIEVKKQDGKILNKTAGKEIEVGIKKIQLRPKKDKMASKTEDAVKSFEGWQEALYIRFDETETGKKAKKDAEDAKTARNAEAFTTLTRDADADKKENKKSFPKSISGPKTIEIGKVATYTLDTYKPSATKADKNNIRWSIWVKGDKVIDYKTIDTKSKAGLYTYAKMEMVGDNNKLTIVFDKALKGKKVQIEPYRGKPDVDQSKKSHDHIKSTSITEPATPKISKRDKAHLYLQTQCDSLENPGQKIEQDFLKNSVFKIATTNTIHIYEDGKMSKLNLGGLKKVKYRYHDANGDKHNICECEVYQSWKLGYGSSKTSLKPSSSVLSSITPINYTAMNVAGVDAKKSYTLSNNDVYTEGKDGGWGYTHLYYKATSEKIEMVVMPNSGLNYSNGKLIVKFVWHETLRRFSQPEVFAAFIGALAECSYKDIDSGGSSFKDGSSYPSKTHNNGFAIDTGYLLKSNGKLDTTRQQKFITAMKKFGFVGQIKGSASKFSSLTGTTGSNSKHNDHLHSGGAPKSDGTKKFDPKYK